MNDLISRQATIESIVNTVSKVDDNKTLKDKYDGAVFRQHEILDIIESVPPARQWIPVSERLPEDGEYVLVCADKIKSAFGPEDCRFLWRWVSGYSEKRVSAWMPLPEPYKGGRSG